MQFSYRGLLSISILGPPLVPIDLSQAPVEHESTSSTLQLLNGIQASRYQRKSHGCLWPGGR